MTIYHKLINGNMLNNYELGDITPKEALEQGYKQLVETPREPGKDYSSGMFANLHTFFNWSASDIVPRPIEVTPLCLCAKCQEEYAREIATELFETYKLKITEIKLRRK